jgi:hypothetical protein
MAIRLNGSCATQTSAFEPDTTYGYEALFNLDSSRLYDSAKTSSTMQAENDTPGQSLGGVDIRVGGRDAEAYVVYPSGPRV